ncbi:molecular chaperone Hsp33 [Breznakia sp. PF5-3]|uniref:Hsp33 family molecular chaperone HslO n=1 Tax=unclassified Breznakia TaxID=2623764 RepID=UPI0024072772|nr:MULTISPECIES: Hsp33 family molecular chaperone HslO [unclassified Breznakia]MDF9824948.1 molecular chaperone Hsp33 [Breznakia sp. PM6-1]MDF9835784.1 molecular chaperone Hsp33 [Breznakia sp. PF5-3]MDF9837922.1 molecular chaperone Hsp33 [Breznakia sp. PFB2-8]MDF9859911.1 molecular chaperone Hsp33 [Breznakia sp. PH5-24]
MKDQLLKALACDGHVRIYICNTTGIINYAQKQHDLWPTASAALGRVLSVASMMGGNLKSDKEKLTITINGGGPIGTIMADAYYGGNVRGFVSEPHVHYQYNDTGKLAVGIAVGTDGYLEVKKDFGLKEEFGGQVALQNGEIGDDFAYYFALSEQTPSAVSVGVLVDSDNTIISSGGLLIQMLPDATEEDIEKTEAVIKTLSPMSELIKDNVSLEEIAKSLYDDVKILEVSDIAFTCNCSREKVENAIKLIDKKDLQEMIDEDHGSEVSCQFCKTTYTFSEAELKAILDSKE